MKKYFGYGLLSLILFFIIEPSYLLIALLLGPGEVGSSIIVITLSVIVWLILLVPLVIGIISIKREEGVKKYLGISTIFLWIILNGQAVLYLIPYLIWRIQH